MNKAHAATPSKVDLIMAISAGAYAIETRRKTASPTYFRDDLQAEHKTMHYYKAAQILRQEAERLEDELDREGKEATPHE